MAAGGPPLIPFEELELVTLASFAATRSAREGITIHLSSSAKDTGGKPHIVSPLKKGYYLIRYIGPRVIWLRAGVYLNKAIGRSRRTFRSRPWNSIDLAEIVKPQVSTEPEKYAEYKRTHPPAFLFPLGQPPAIPPELRSVDGGRQPTFAERVRLLAEDRCVYFFRTPSPAPIDWYVNPIDDHRSIPGQVWVDIPDYLPEQGDLRTLWEPSRAAWAIAWLGRRPRNECGCR